MDELIGIAGEIAELLVARGETVAVAESSAGGLVSAALLAVPGASRYFMGGAVTYTGSARDAFLAPSRESLAGLRSSSEPYAAMLAAHARTRLGTDWGLAETGAAGPSGNRYGDAPGHTCVAVAGALDRVATLETGSPDRAANMQAFAAEALRLFRDTLRAV